MRSSVKLGFAALLIAMSGLGCAGNPDASAPPSTPRESMFQRTPTPVPMAEQVISEPITDTIPSETVIGEELPQDLVTLNSRGYLQDVFFATDRYELTPEARETLAGNASWLQNYSSVTILVEGHCDDRNTREYNLALGERRANAVRDYLVFLGIGPDRVQTISYGEERPFAPGNNEAAWQLNRRSHLEITAR